MTDQTSNLESRETQDPLAATVQRASNQSDMQPLTLEQLRFVAGGPIIENGGATVIGH
jgi:hypothetical protein